MERSLRKKAHYLETLDKNITKKIEGCSLNILEKKPIMMSFWVSLSGWSKDREVRVQDGFAYFEVAEQGHCSICQGRIRSVHSAIDKSGIASTDIRTAYLYDRYPGDAKTLWIGVKTEEGMTMAQVVEKLKTVMSLPIVHAYQR